MEILVYNQRGTAEPWIKEGKLAVKMKRLSLIAYNLGNL